MKVTIETILKKYLTDNGYDGFHNGACACKLPDIGPCDLESDKCQPGYLVETLDEDWPWEIVATKGTK